MWALKCPVAEAIEVVEVRCSLSAIIALNNSTCVQDWKPEASGWESPIGLPGMVLGA